MRPRRHEELAPGALAGQELPLRRATRRPIGELVRRAALQPKADQKRNLAVRAS